MNSLKAIERVCDKRHARLMALGKSELEASEAVYEYLERLRKVWKHSPVVLGFIRALQDGYSAVLANTTNYRSGV